MVSALRSMGEVILLPLEFLPPEIGFEKIGGVWVTPRRHGSHGEPCHVSVVSLSLDAGLRGFVITVKMVHSYGKNEVQLVQTQQNDVIKLNEL